MLNTVKNSKNLNQNQPNVKVVSQQSGQIVPIKAGFTQFDVINAIYDSKILSEVKLTAGARLVLISLARHYNPSKDEFFPSYTCISSHTGVSKKSVERAIKELVAAGLITYRTEKVNRYRFTGHFFASVKMTPPQRQNDDCDRGQNVAQTNNFEKRKNKSEKVLNFSFLAQNAKKPLETEVSGSSDGRNLETNENDTSILALSNFSARDGQNDVQSRVMGENRGQNARYQGVSAVYGASRSYPRYNVPSSERKGGSSFTPSVSSTDEYLKSIRASREAACSPLDFDYDAAKRWYSSLSAPLKSTSLAKKVAAKFPDLLDY